VIDMAYASYNVSTTLEVVEAMVDFAQNLAGWTASMTSSDTGTFTAPGKDRSFTVQSVLTNWSSRSNVPTIYLDLTGTPPTGYERSLTFFHQTSQGSTSGTIGGPPSRVDLFGRASPTPFIVAAVETQPGSFRHLYMGYVEQFALFAGGEIISGCPDPHYVPGIDAFEYHGFRTPSLFEYPVSTTNFPSASSGGININGTFAKFRRSGLFVEGGPRRRSMLSPLRTINAFSGYTPLNPINLYYGTESSTQDYWIPIGTPAGVRTLSMANFFPGQQVTLPDESAWRVYPLRKKGPNTNSIGNPETSGDYGFAFLMDD